jgi:hypothetical protein
MSTAVRTRFKTGEKCVNSGRYVFDGYLDGSSTPPPKPEERQEPIAKGNTFPPIRSCNKGCWWELKQHI